MSNFKCLENLAPFRIEYGNRSRFLGSDVDQLSVWRDFDSLGLGPHFRRLDHRARSHINDADGFVVFVGDKQLSPVLADIEVLWIRPTFNHADYLVLCR